MRKRNLYTVLLFILMCGLPACDGALITITAPPDGEVLIQGNACTIRWTHSDYYLTHPETCQVYCGSAVISPPIPVTDKQFVWTVGKKADGSMIPLGHYEITIESDEYDALNGPRITTIAAAPGRLKLN